jgi:hypothetical protein
VVSLVAAYAWWHFIDTPMGIFNIIYDSALFGKAFNR